jgi:alkylated DNA nucleotide flippase Atl1
MDKQKSIPEISFEAKLLIEALVEIEPEQVCTYGQLSEVIGRRVTRGLIQTALNRILRDYGRDFLCVRGVGLKRVTANTSVQARVAETRERAARQLRRKSRHLDFLPEEELSKDAQLQKRAFQAQSATLLHFLKTPTAKQIEQRASEEKPLNIAGVIEMFKAS